ncbi:protein phosphatase 2C domain-containing protein [Streptomyces sp. NPDC049597]|uniref:protein phosphatase 2C domain-containing protein n=1 Tax=Streptomyces sp. NPDC049597 TaxID=3155276 RepID=UPI003412B30A
MSEQGERPGEPTAEDDWWSRLYDDSAPDTGPGPTRTDDTLDTRFASASGTVSRPGARGNRIPASADIPAQAAATPDGPPAEGGSGPASEVGDSPPTALPGWPPDGSRVDGGPPPPRRLPDDRSAKAGPRPPSTGAVPPTGVPGAPAPDGPPDGGGRAPGVGGPLPPRRLPDDRSAKAGPRPPSTDAVPPAGVPGAPAPDGPPDGGGRAPGAGGPPPAVPPAPGGAPAQGGLRPGRVPDEGGGRRRAVDADGGEAPPGPEGDARPRIEVVGGGPPTYEAEPTALPAAEALALEQLVPDTVLDGARYGTYTLRAASVRGDSARYRGEPRRDALLTARFGTGPAALVLVAVAGGSRHAENARLAAADAVRWIGTAVGRSHARLAEDIRAGRRDDLKSGLHRLTDRGFGRLRARAAELGLEPEQYTAGLRCLLLSADPDCRTRVFFGAGPGGLFRLRDGVWQDIEPLVPEQADGASAETPYGERLTADRNTTAPPPPADPFRFRAGVARPGDTLLLCSNGLAEPLRGEPALAAALTRRWEDSGPPGMTQFLADIQLRVKGYADDRTAVGVWEA